MKRFVITALCACLSAMVFGQKTQPTAKTLPAAKTIMKNQSDSACYAMGMGLAKYYQQQGTKSVNTNQVMKGISDVFSANKVDSNSYAMGLSFGSYYKQMGVKTINPTLIAKGINDVFGNKKTAFDDNAANSVMNSYLMKLQEQKSQPNIEAGEAFLKQNKTKPGVQTTPSGLQYEVLREGTGPKPTILDSVTCDYRGTLLNGNEFDNSYSRGAPITFSLRGVVAGWTEGLQLMSEGAKYKFYVPYNLAYGAFDYGPIPGGSMLIFEIELRRVIKHPEAVSDQPKTPGN